MVDLPFPGNFPELRNLVSYAAVHAPHDILDAMDTFALIEQTKLPHQPSMKRFSLPPARQIEVEQIPPSPDPKFLSQARKLVKHWAAALFDRAFLEYWYPCCQGHLAELSRRTGLSRAYLYKTAKRGGSDFSRGERPDNESGGKHK